MTGLRSSANLLRPHPVALYRGVMCNGGQGHFFDQSLQNLQLMNIIMRHAGEKLINDRQHSRVAATSELIGMLLKKRVRSSYELQLSTAFFSSRQAKLSKDIFDLLGLHCDRRELFGAVAVCLYHQHQQVAVRNLLHHKHPEKPNKHF